METREREREHGFDINKQRDEKTEEMLPKEHLYIIYIQDFNSICTGQKHTHKHTNTHTETLTQKLLLFGAVSPRKSKQTLCLYQKVFKLYWPSIAIKRV